jgi:hypothetical protein
MNSLTLEKSIIAVWKLKDLHATCFFLIGAMSALSFSNPDYIELEFLLNITQTKQTMEKEKK